MNVNMWENPTVVYNVAMLRELYKANVIEPVEGKLACGDVGIGKMESLKLILDINLVENINFLEKQCLREMNIHVRHVQNLNLIMFIISYH